MSDKGHWGLVGSAFIFGVLAVLSACGGGGSSTSTLNLGITDAPLAGATKVWIQFTGVELKPVNGDPITETLQSRTWLRSADAAEWSHSDVSQWRSDPGGAI
jgi:hypothetical protein